MENDNRVRIPRKRWFLVAFSGLDPNNELRTGKLECKTSTGKHISERFVQDLIMKDFGLKSVFVTAVQEMNEADFNDFTEGNRIPPTTDMSDTSFI